MTRGHFRLLGGVNLVATLGDGVASTLDIVAPSTLCSLVFSTFGGVATHYL